MDQETPETASEDLYIHHQFTVDPGQDPIRLDVFLRRLLGDVSRTRIQAAADQGLIRVNDRPRKPSYKVRGRDQIFVLLPQPPRTAEIIPQPIPLDILFEDEHILVMNKPAGMVVHPGVGNPDGTVVNAVLWHVGVRTPLREDVQHPDDFPRPGLVHRLDKNTSGLMVVAKTDQALAHLAGQFFHKTARREYLALVWGRVSPESGTICVPIGRCPHDRKIMEAKEDPEEGKPAITHYTVEKHFNFTTLVRCRLETGRTHQIRVHMKHIGHTLFNDLEYGGQYILKGPNTGAYRQFMKNCMELLPGQALHAGWLRLMHPTRHKEMEFSCPPPPGFQEVLRRMEEGLRLQARL